jgi:hypothetical protein
MVNSLRRTMPGTFKNRVDQSRKPPPVGTEPLSFSSEKNGQDCTEAVKTIYDAQVCYFSHTRCH